MGRGLFKIWRKLVVVSAVFCTCTNLYAGCEDLLRQFSPQEIAAAQRVRELQIRVAESRDKAGLTEVASNSAAEAVAFNRLYQGLKSTHPEMTPADLRAALQTFTPKKDAGREDIKVTTEEEIKKLKTNLTFRSIFEEAAGVDKNIILDAPPESFEFVEILDENSVTVELGSPDSEVGRFNDEPLRTVALTGPLEMQRTPFTQEQWVSLIPIKKNPSHFKNENQVKLLGIDVSHGHPVEYVSWDDVQGVIKILNDRDNRYKYALSPEAVWEYAARAGNSTPYYFGKDEKLLEEHAWFDKNSGGKTHPVATRLSNPFGLFDMYGNVWEWGQDNYTETPPSGTNPLFDNGGSGRVVRGGSWVNDARGLRSANRGGVSADGRDFVVGFRLVRTPK